MQKRQLIQYAGKYGDETYTKNVFDVLQAFNKLDESTKQYFKKRYNVEISVEELKEMFKDMDKIKDNKDEFNKYLNATDKKNMYKQTLESIQSLILAVEQKDKKFNDNFLNRLNEYIREEQMNTQQPSMNPMNNMQQPMINEMNNNMQQPNSNMVQQPFMNPNSIPMNSNMFESGLNKESILEKTRQIEDSIKQAQGLVNELKTNLGVTDAMMGGKKRRSKKDNRVVRRSPKKQSPKKQQRGGKQKSPKK